MIAEPTHDPTPKERQLRPCLDDKTYAALKYMAAIRGLSLTSYVEAVLKDAAESREQ